MTKQIRFGDKDEEQIQKIRAYQKAQGLSTFIDAVRVLCKNGLRMNDAATNLRNVLARSVLVRVALCVFALVGGYARGFSYALMVKRRLALRLVNSL